MDALGGPTLVRRQGSGDYHHRVLGDENTAQEMLHLGAFFLKAPPAARREIAGLPSKSFEVRMRSLHSRDLIPDAGGTIHVTVAFKEQLAWLVGR